jgi:predicted N-formylglutamate amidohydrolase
MQSHRAYDIGARDIFHFFCDKLEVDFSLEAEYSRLLVELNRSKHHPNLFSSITKDLSPEEKRKIISHYYLPFRRKVENKIGSYLKQGFEVVHLSIHSFTPELDGEIRNASVGLLYDPKNKIEKELCRLWKSSFQSYNSGFKLRFNYPYKGTADGFTSYLRKKFSSNYAGIELEVNNKHIAKANYLNLLKCLTESFEESYKH